MPIDASIYQAFAPRPRGALEYAQDFAGLDAAKEAQATNVLNRQMGQAKFDEYQRGVQKATALEQLMGSMAGKSEADVLQGLRGAGRFNEAGTFEKGILERDAKRGDIAKDAATTKKTEDEVKTAKKKQAVYDIAILPNIEAVRASIAEKVAGPEKLPANYAQALLQSLPQDPAQFAQWKNDLILKLATPEAQQTAATAAARNAQTARNDLIGTDGKPNQQLIAVKTGLAKAAIRPRATGGGGGGGGASAGASSLTGEALMASLPTADRAIVKGLVDGTVVPNDISTKGNRREQLIALAKQYSEGANLTGRRPEADKPLPAKERQSLVDARTNASTIGSLLTEFKDDFASKGVLGVGSEFALGAKSVLGTDTDTVQWWKNYRKMAELVERHAMFGASLTEGEKAAWASADISPKMDATVIRANLATRKALADKVLQSTQQDLIDSGFPSEKVVKIGGRDVTVPLDGKAQPGMPSPGAIAKELARRAAGGE
jgi:hypothetical protein